MANKRDPQTERKLRPLYDALDNLNNKQAVQRADKILKKEKDFHCAKVLKALALVRLIKPQEALDILEEVKANFPLDEATLQAMSVCYKELLLPEHIPELYETALKYSPNSEDLLTQLYMGYVRIQAYKKQQQVATRLHKLTSTTAYSYWNAVSLLFMGKENPELGKVMCFPLALKIIEKSKEKSKEVTEEVFRLYLEVLSQLGMNEKALEELEDPKNIIVDTRERLRLKIHYNSKVGNIAKCNILYKQAILSEPDSYDFYRGYFDTAFQLLTDTTSLHIPDYQVDPDTPDTGVHQMTGLLLKVSQDSEVLIRSPHLAKGELVLRLKERSIELCSFATPTVLVLEYVQKFGHKLCCYDDLRVVIDRLSETEKRELMEILEEYRATVKDSNGTKAMQRLATIHLLLYHLGKYSNIDPEQLMLVFEEIKNFHDITLEPDLGCNYVETFALLFTYLKCTSPTKPNIVESIKMLTSKLDQFPEGSASRILATKLYALLGAVGPSTEMYQGLDTKSVQMDSLAHLLYPSLIPHGAFNRADERSRQLESFYRTSEREVLEYIVKSYLNGNFHKVSELFEFHDSLVNSISKSVFLLDKLWLSLLLSTSNSWNQIETLLDGVRDEISSIKTDKLIDNRDYNVNEICESRHPEIAQFQSSTSYTHDTIYIKMRCFMLNSLLDLQKMARSKDEVGLQEKLTAFENDVIEKSSALPDPSKYPVYLMMSQSMSVWKHYVSSLSDIVRESRKILKHCVYGEQNDFSLDKITSKLSELLQLTKSKLIVNETLDSCSLPYLSALLQTVCFTVLCVSAGVTGKVQRKKRGVAETAINSLKTSVGELKSLLENCTAIATQHKLESLTIDKEDSVDSRIASSVEWSLEEIAAVVVRITGLVSSLQSRLHPKS